MQVLKQDYPSITLLPENLADLWYLEKIIDPGDEIASVTFRKFKTETGESERKRVWIKIRVEKVDFQRFSNVLRVLGTILEGRPEELVSFGSHHTIEISPGTSFTLTKRKWLNYHKTMIERAIQASKKPKLVLVAMDDDQASIYVLREVGLDPLAELYCQGKGKWKEVDESVKLNYFHSIAKSLSGTDAPNIIIGGPGFAKEEFKEFCKENYPELLKKLVMVDVSSAGRAGINEILSRPEINRVLEEARIARETKLVNELLAEIGKDGLATYGLSSVEEALDYGAVEKLLITEGFFSENREKCEELMQKAEQTRAEIFVVGEDHDAGKQLKALGGVAAILRFKI